MTDVDGERLLEAIDRLGDKLQAIGLVLLKWAETEGHLAEIVHADTERSFLERELVP